jgi:hypothetical protein
MRYAVLTGDLIRSTDLSSDALAEAPVVLEEVFRWMRESASEPMRFSITAGDGWQMLLPDPRRALRMALAFRAALWDRAHLATRLAIAVDTVDVVRDDLNASNGAAFQRSGRALAALSQGQKHPPGLQGPVAASQQMLCLLPSQMPPVWQDYAETLVHFADTFAKSWTQSQAQAVAAIVLHEAELAPSYYEIGQAWRGGAVRKQTVGRHLQRAGWADVALLIERFERFVATMEALEYA